MENQGLTKSQEKLQLNIQCKRAVNENVSLRFIFSFRQSTPRRQSNPGASPLLTVIGDRCWAIIIKLPKKELSLFWIRLFPNHLVKLIVSGGSSHCETVCQRLRREMDSFFKIQNPQIQCLSEGCEDDIKEDELPTPWFPHL